MIYSQIELLVRLVSIIEQLTEEEGTLSEQGNIPLQLQISKEMETSDFKTGFLVDKVVIETFAFGYSKSRYLCR